MAEKRLFWLDNLKFIGMFYIYIGHLGHAAGKIYPFVFTFHVPLFFFISGLFFKSCLSANDLAVIVKKSFRRIVIPYLVFSLIGISVYAIKSNLPTTTIINMMTDAIYGIRNQVPMASLWFLPCLFIVIVYQSALHLVFKSKWLIFLIAFIIYLLTPYWGSSMPSVIFNLDSALYYLTFYSFGAAISTTLLNSKFENILSRYKYLWCLVVLFSLSLFAFVYQYGVGSIVNIVDVHQLKLAFLFIIKCLLFIPSIALSRCIYIEAIEHLGRNSLVLCGTEQILKVMVPAILLVFGVNIQIKDPLQAVIYTAMLMAISYFTIVKIYEGLNSKFSKREVEDS